MSGARFVRFYPSDWRSGCMGLTPEEEGVYMRACAHGWETGVRLPLDDYAAASRLTLDVRMWRRIKTKLIEKGKLHVASDGIFNPRAEREFEAATRAKQQADAQADMGSARHADDRQHEDRGSPLAGREPAGQGVLADVDEKSPESLGEVSEIFATKDNEINGPLKEPIARANRYEEDDCAHASAVHQFSIDEETCLEFHRVCLNWGVKPGEISFGQPTIDDTTKQLAGEVKGMAVQHPDAVPRILHAALLTAVNSLTAKSIEAKDGSFKGRGSGSAASYLRKTYSSEILRMMREDANAEAQRRADHHMQTKSLERRVSGGSGRAPAGGGWAAAMAASEA